MTTTRLAGLRGSGVGLVEVAVPGQAGDGGLGHSEVVDQEVRNGLDPLLAQLAVVGVIEFGLAVGVERPFVRRPPVEREGGMGSQGSGDARGQVLHGLRGVDQLGGAEDEVAVRHRARHAVAPRVYLRDRGRREAGDRDRWRARGRGTGRGGVASMNVTEVAPAAVSRAVQTVLR